MFSSKLEFAPLLVGYSLCILFVGLIQLVLYKNKLLMLNVRIISKHFCALHETKIWKDKGGSVSKRQPMVHLSSLS